MKKIPVNIRARLRASGSFVWKQILVVVAALWCIILTVRKTMWTQEVCT